MPSGKETGRFLSLDLGGTNFRVLCVDIGENKTFSMQSKVFAIPREIMVGTGDALFDHIASCLHEFIVEHSLKDQKLPLGFTFSFPCKQEGLAKVVKKGHSTSFTFAFSSVLRWLDNGDTLRMRIGQILTSRF